MGDSQLRVKPTSVPTLPAQYPQTTAAGDQLIGRMGAGIAGKAFDPRVTEHGDQWVAVNGPVMVGGRGPTGLVVPFRTDGLGNVVVVNLDPNGAIVPNYQSIAVDLFHSAAQTTTQTSPDIFTYGLKNLKVIMDTTVFGTGSVTLTINAKDPSSGKYVLLLSGAAVVSVVTNTYNVGPTLVASANVTATAQLGNIIQIVATANNANTQTYSVGYILS